jgi:DNA-nicking Smr family endonuclease
MLLTCPLLTVGSSSTIIWGVAKRPFHNPFGKLKDLRAPDAKPAQASTPSQASRPAATHVPSDTELWAQATQDVQRLREGFGFAAPRPPAPPATEFYHPDLDTLRKLEALVSGEAPFDLSDSDEFIEGRISGLDANIVRRLRGGEYSVQGHIDLHGMTRSEAKVAIDRYLREARRQGKRCVLVVHGRGIHSRDQVPILKEALRNWLATSRFGRHVLAFATARPVDGGAGAIYVLLRRTGR